MACCGGFWWRCCRSWWSQNPENHLFKHQNRKSHQFKKSVGCGSSTGFQRIVLQMHCTLKPQLEPVRPNVGVGRNLILMRRSGDLNTFRNVARKISPSPTVTVTIVPSGSFVPASSTITPSLTKPRYARMGNSLLENILF